YEHSPLLAYSFTLVISASSTSPSYTLSLHDALPILGRAFNAVPGCREFSLPQKKTTSCVARGLMGLTIVRPPKYICLSRRSSRLSFEETILSIINTGINHNYTVNIRVYAWIFPL